MDNFFEFKEILFELKAKVEVLEATTLKWFSLSDISYEIGYSRDTMRKYLKSNFEPEIDFKSSGGKIYVSRGALFHLRKHYEKK